MIDIDRFLKKTDTSVRLALQIHDELLLTVAQSQVDAVQSMVIRELENVVSWEVPLTVNYKIGKNWKEVS